MERPTFLSEVGQRLRTMNKNCESFRHMKKLKQAVETINRLESINLEAIDKHGQASVSCVNMLVYFFGAGTEKDELLVRSVSPECAHAEIHVAAGSPYGLISFTSQTEAQTFAIECQLLAELALFRLIQQEGAERILFFFSTPIATDQLQLFRKLQISDCSSNYVKQPIPGLNIFNEFITEQEEEDLVRAIDQQKWTRLSNRKVQHYGFQFKYGRNSIDKDEHDRPIPEFLHGMMARLRQQKISEYEFDQLTINCYDPGDGIPSHFDTHSPFEEVFISLSVLGDIVMEFESFTRQQQQVLLRRRSLAMFSGEARYAWKHAICPRKMDCIDSKLVWRRRRISLTFRTIRHRPCQCPYFFYCDSQGYDQEKMKRHNPLLKQYLAKRQPADLTKLSAKEIEDEYVERAYNAFGWTFSNPLHPKVCSFIDGIHPGSLVLDVGCGNGYYMKLIERAGSYPIGIEKCISMGGNALDNAHQERFLGDAVLLPFRTGAFDSVVMVAVWHHFASEARRKQSLKEVARVLRPGGKAMITVMGFELQDIYDKRDSLMDFSLPLHRKGSVQPINAQKPFTVTSNCQIYYRYYHFFSRQEIIDQVADVLCLKLLTLQEEFGNYYLVLQKTV